MDWISTVYQATLDFIAINSGLGLMFVAVGGLIARKYQRHKSGNPSHAFKQLKKYPGEVLELLIVAIIFILGVVKYVGLL